MYWKRRVMETAWNLNDTNNCRQKLTHIVTLYIDYVFILYCITQTRFLTLQLLTSDILIQHNTLQVMKRNKMSINTDLRQVLVLPSKFFAEVYVLFFLEQINGDGDGGYQSRRQFVQTEMEKSFANNHQRCNLPFHRHHQYL